MTVPDTGELGLDGQADCGKGSCSKILQGADLQMKKHLWEKEGTGDSHGEGEEK